VELTVEGYRVTKISADKQSRYTWQDYRAKGGRGGSQPECHGANRNLLIDVGPVDPLTQTAALSSSYVGVERV
jgi:hypothetical protein